MVQGLITRIVTGEKATIPTVNDLKEAEKAYQKCLHAAIRFCDLDLHENGQRRDDHATVNAKNALREYCNQRSEGPRSQPLVELLNTLLQYFRHEDLGFGRGHNTPRDRNEIRYIANDTTIVASKRLPTTITKRKADILALRIEHIPQPLCDECQCKDRDCTEGSHKNIEISWEHVLQSWELEANETIDFTRMSSPYGRLGQGAEDESVVNYLRKAGIGWKLEGRGNDRSNDNHAASRVPTEPNHSVRQSPVMHSAYYAIERLTARGKCVLHTMGVILQDSKLQLSWYDAQGIVESEPIDIIADFPHFIVMIMIFQRFDDCMWGEAPFTYDRMPFKEFSSGIDIEYRLEGQAEPSSYELIGRHTIQGSVRKRVESGVAVANAPDEISDSQLALAYMKLSWTPLTRQSEAEILRQVFRDAPLKLKQYANFVTDHIAEPVATLDLPQTSTAIIRQIFGCKTRGTRVLQGLITTPLRPITELKGEQFWTAFWHIILGCHALLWRVGIAHGNISLQNLMYRRSPATQSILGSASSVGVTGVLDGLDLASLIDPRTGNPKKTAVERAATNLFAAYELLTEDGVAGKIPRKYRHDLESFAWVAAYVCGCVQDGQESVVHPFDRWLTGPVEKIRAFKADYWQRGEITPTPDFQWLQPIASLWLMAWRDIDREHNTRRRRPEADGLVYLQRIVKEIEGENPAVPMMPWLVELGTIYEESENNSEPVSTWNPSAS